MDRPTATNDDRLTTHRFDWKRLVGAVVIGLVALEAVARVAPLLAGWQVHQKLACRVGPCTEACFNQGKQLTWAFNERGARGDSYRGEPIRLAVFGSSTSACTLLDQHETWPERVRAELGAERVHIDNYALDGCQSQHAIAILGRLAELGRRYDIVLAVVHAGDGPDVSADSIGYSGQWAATDGPLQAPSLLVRRIKKQVAAEPRLMAMAKWATDLTTGPTGSQRPPRTASSKRELRNSGAVRFRDAPLEPDPERDRRVADQFERLIDAASRVADRVVLITQPVAYDTDQAPGVAEKWVSLYPVEGEPNTYLSNRSIAERRRHANEVLARVARERGVPLVELDAALRPLLRQRADLFDDKWHFTPPGAYEAGRVVAESIEPLLPPSE